MKTRKTLRLKYYNYSEIGLYYITICTYKKEKILCSMDEKICDANFDEIEFEKYIKYTDIGNICKTAIDSIEKNYENVKVDNFVIMPNHIHMIISIKKNNDIKISQVVSYFKSYVSREYNKISNKKNEIWQKSFYEHVIRNDDDYKRIVEYVVYNPLKWKVDEYY